MFMKNVYWCDVRTRTRSVTILFRNRHVCACMQCPIEVQSRNMKIHYYEVHCTNLVECDSSGHTTALNTTPIYVCIAYNGRSLFFFANANNTYATISINIFHMRAYYYYNSLIKMCVRLRFFLLFFFRVEKNTKWFNKFNSQKYTKRNSISSVFVAVGKSENSSHQKRNDL